MAKWDHDKVILALAQRGAKISNLENVDIYLHLYPQKPNVALIFTSSSPQLKGKWQVQLRETHKNFDNSKISGKDKFLQLASTTKDWNNYHVTDWDAFANKLGLTFGAKDDDE